MGLWPDGMLQAAMSQDGALHQDGRNRLAVSVVVPAKNAWAVDDAIPDRHAAVFDPCGNAMHAATMVPLAGNFP